MYKIYRTKQCGRVYMGKAATVKKAVEIITEYIDIHNMGVMYEMPQKKYVHTMGDINEQIANGKVKTYSFNDYAEWYSPKYDGTKIMCKVCKTYAYHRRGISKEVRLEDNCDVIHLSDSGVVTFYWEED